MHRIPAVCGGEPVFPQGPPPWPLRDPDVAEALQRAYSDGSWGRYHGPHQQALIEQLLATLGVEQVRLCSSGTIAVELALRGLDVQAGDEVILGGYDFPGNFRAVEAVGATPVLVDLDPETWGLDVAQVAAAYTKKTKAILATHLHGALVDMPRLCAAAKDLGLSVVEDACQAAGATVYDRPAGTWGDAGVFSFGGSKLLTAGRGGAVVTRRPEVAQRIKVFSERGNDAFPLSELQAAVLLPQWLKLPERHARRLSAARLIAARLRDAVGIRVAAANHPQCEPAYYKLGVVFESNKFDGVTRNEFCAAARAEGIALDPGFRGFVGRGAARCRRHGKLPVAASIAEQMMLLHHPVLLEGEETILRVADTLRELAEGLYHRRFELASNAPLDSTATEP